MVGISHVAFRDLVRSYTPKDCFPVTTYTEMLATKFLPQEKVGLTMETRLSHGETHFRYQLLGNAEPAIAASLEKLLPSGPTGIDINMGCPVKHVLKHNWGVALMGNPEYAAEVVKITKKYSAGLPVSVKMRTGFENHIDSFHDFIKKLEDAGADEITIHPRTASRGHKGRAHWDLLPLAQKHVQIPVIGNGDIQCVQDLFTLKDLGIAGAMVARSLTARPWIFWQYYYQMGLTKEAPPLSAEEEGHACGMAWIKLSRSLNDYFGPQIALERLRFHVSQGWKWLEFGHYLWAKLTGAKNISQAQEILFHFFQMPQKMLLRTELAR